MVILDIGLSRRIHATYLTSVSPGTKAVRFILPKNDGKIVKNESKLANTIMIILEVINEEVI